MEFHSSSRKAQGTPRPKRISALQRVAGPMAQDRDVGSSLDDFIASANSTLTGMDGWNLADEDLEEVIAEAGTPPATAPRMAAASTPPPIKEAPAAHEPSPAEIARATAEAEAKRVLADINRHSAMLQAQLAAAEERAVRMSQQMAVPSLTDMDLIKSEPKHSGFLKGMLVMAGAAGLAAAIFLVGNGRWWNTSSNTATPAAQAQPAAAEVAPAMAAQPTQPIAQPMAAQPAASQPVAEPMAASGAGAPPAQPAQPAASSETEAPSVTSLPEKPAEQVAEAVAEANGEAAVPVVSSLAPSVEPLDEAAEEVEKPAKKTRTKRSRPARKSRSSKSSKATSKKKSSKGAPKSGGIVDPFAQ